ncbi:DUF4340 domain-containing protein [Endothiovibrio diazotrophicus]
MNRTMNNTMKLLAVVLAAQLLLALAVGTEGPGLAVNGERVPLVAAAKEKVDHLILEGPDQAKVELVRKGDGWQLPAVDGFPADGGRVDQLLDRLIALKGGSAVATSDGARERFRVDDQNFERRITLRHGDEALATLYLGTSPGMHLVHARSGENDAIYAVKLATYDVPVKRAAWEKKDLLGMSRKEIVAIGVDGLSIERAAPPAAAGDKEDAGKQEASPAPGWILKGGEGSLDVAAADKLAGLLADLRIDEALGREVKPEYGLEKPRLAFTVTRHDGEVLSYALGSDPQGKRYTLKRSDRPEYFRVAGYVAEPLIAAAGRDALLGIEAASKAATGEAK